MLSYSQAVPQFSFGRNENKLWVVVRQLRRQLGKHKNKLLNLWKNISPSLCEVSIIKVQELSKITHNFKVSTKLLSKLYLHIQYDFIQCFK